MIFNFLLVVCSNFIFKSNKGTGTNTALYMKSNIMSQTNFKYGFDFDKPVLGGYDQRHNTTMETIMIEFRLLNKIKQHHFNMKLLNYLNQSYMKTLPLELIKDKVDELHGLDGLGLNLGTRTILPNITKAGLFADWDASCDF